MWFRSRYGLVGLLRPLTVYPSEMVYWMVGVHEMVLYLLSLTATLLFSELTDCFCLPRYLPFLMWWRECNH